jgi:hypothetical protein
MTRSGSIRNPRDAPSRSLIRQASIEGSSMTGGDDQMLVTGCFVIFRPFRNWSKTTP